MMNTMSKIKSTTFLRWVSSLNQKSFILYLSLLVFMYHHSCSLHYDKNIKIFNFNNGSGSEEDEKKSLALKIAEKKLTPSLRAITNKKMGVPESLEQEPYSQLFFYEDNAERIQIVVYARAQSEVNKIEREIEIQGGIIQAEYMENSRWIYTCWVPYYNIKNLALLYEVESIKEFIPIPLEGRFYKN